MEVKRRTAKMLVRKLSSVSEQNRTEALCELRLMSKHDADSRSVITEAGAIPYLAESLYSPSTISQENATATLLNLSISSRESLMSTRGLLDALSHALSNPSSPSTAQSAAATLYSLLTVDEYRPIIGSKRDIVYALIHIVRTPNSLPRSIKDALKALFGMALYPLNRSTLIQLGAVPALFSLVVNDGRIGLVEDATAVIAQIAGCEEAGDAFPKVSGIGVLADLLDPSTGSSDRTKENAVSALLNLLQFQSNCNDFARTLRNIGLPLSNGIAYVAHNGTSKAKTKAIQLRNTLQLDASTHFHS